jgi:hypothetical protein
MDLGLPVLFRSLVEPAVSCCGRLLALARERGTYGAFESVAVP